jgi:SAM-dependent methyltransferase
MPAVFGLMVLPEVYPGPGPAFRLAGIVAKGLNPGMDDKLEQNRRYWDQAARAHVDSAYYDVEGFRRGRDSLTPLEDEELGDVAGKDLLHLQCHFGMDTLSLARRGARVTGVDFSPRAIRAARGLAAELDLPARFVLSDVDHLPDHLEGDFDLVYTGWGVKAWLPDLTRWAEVIFRFLRPGGRLHFLEIHPYAHIYAEDEDAPRIAHSYFVDGPRRFETSGASYAVDSGIEADHTWEWFHPISEIFAALLGAGLAIESFREFPWTTFEHFPWLERREDGCWHIPEGLPSVPLSFALRAGRP